MFKLSYIFIFTDALEVLVTTGCARLIKIRDTRENHPNHPQPSEGALVHIEQTLQSKRQSNGIAINEYQHQLRGTSVSY